MTDRIPQPAHELGRLIAAGLRAKGMSRRELVQAMGYTNINKGLRVLDCHLTDYDFQQRILTEVPRILEIDLMVFQDALIETCRELEERNREQRRLAFQPHIRVLTEYPRPRQITMAVLSGAANLKFLSVPEEILAEDMDEQLHLVGELVRKHFTRGDNRNVFAGQFRATGFRSIWNLVMN